MSTSDHRAFVRHRRKVLAAVVLASVVAVLGAAELGLRLFLGLGNPVLYDSNPLYGFRPLPNSLYKRFGGVTIRFNNLGLRAERDFDPDRGDKVLFLGDFVT